MAAAPVTWKSDALAAAIGTTPGFLGQVLTPLVHAGWVRSAFGPTGGYRYASPATPPSLLDVIVAVEGPMRHDECVLHNGTRCALVSGAPVCALHEGWLQAREALLAVLGGTDALDTGAAAATEQPDQPAFIRNSLGGEPIRTTATSRS